MFFWILVVFGLRGVRGIRKSPLTGGAEALLGQTGRRGGNAAGFGRRAGETVGRAGETAETLRRDWGI